jgi:hypothetical protein
MGVKIVGKCVSRRIVSNRPHVLDIRPEKLATQNIDNLQDSPVIPGVTRIAANHRRPVVDFPTRGTNPNGGPVCVLLRVEK